MCWSSDLGDKNDSQIDEEIEVVGSAYWQVNLPFKLIP
jgi:hypothetical protein